MVSLNLPQFPASNCHNLLLAGMGGGFDIFCGLPLYFEFQQLNLFKTIHLANLSFSKILFSPSANVQNVIRLTDTLVGVTADTENLQMYCPELYLAQWFRKKQAKNVTIWCFKVTGVQTLLTDYQRLLNHLSVDGILLIDGGVDSLVTGNEAKIGTVIEDALSLAVISQLNTLSFRSLACLGFGTERDMSYSHILENIAKLTEVNGFLGSCSLLKTMQCYKFYESAIIFVQNQNYQSPSVVNSSIVSSIKGKYGDYHLTQKTKGNSLWINPLMSIYWFFEIDPIIHANLFLPELLPTRTFTEVMKVMAKFIRNRPKRLLSDNSLFTS